MNAGMRKRSAFLPAAVLFSVLAAILAVFAASDTAYASFNPRASASVSDPTPGANADVITTFNIDAPDVNFSAVISFTPPEWGIARDADIPDGAIVGELQSLATLGLINGGCTNQLPVSFTFMDATTNPAQTIPFDDPEVAAGNPAGDTGDDLDDQFDIGPDGLPLGVTKYPDYLTRIFPGQTPIARLYAQTTVSGIEVSLNFLLFEPGTTFQTAFGTLETDPALGYPSVTVLQSVGDPKVQPSTRASNSISDFCTPLESSPTTYGVSRDNPDTAADESGYVVRTNPSTDGTFNFVVFAAGLRDADGDGWENSLDPCPLDPDPDWDPRATVVPGMPGDSDGDRLPDSCDPDPETPSPLRGGLHDEDTDLYGNRGDNCPLVPNGPNEDNQKDTDRDGIGDACDPEPNVPNGALPVACVVSQVTIGAGGEAPPAPNLCTQSQVGIDLNGNGVFDSLEEEEQQPAAQETPEAQASPTPGGPVSGGPSTGIGSLAPAAASIPAWAVIASGLGGAGLLGTLGAILYRALGIRLPGRRDR